MRRFARKLVGAACAGACFTLVVAPAAFAAEATADGSQLMDVTKQVTQIQRQMADLVAHGRWARTGKLLAAADCGYGPDTQAFLPWADSADYTLAPQGDFASADEWTLNKTATVVTGGDPFTGATQSLQLGNGGQAASPAMCVNLDNPTMRFFTRDVGGNGKSSLKVDLLYEDLDGHVKHLTIARVKAGGEWQPSVVLPIYMNVVASATPDGMTAVALSFKAEGVQKDETLSISSLYVDPFHSR
jgi:hypothetical protein